MALFKETADFNASLSQSETEYLKYCTDFCMNVAFVCRIEINLSQAVPLLL